jgi:hypothetical protein
MQQPRPDSSVVERGPEKAGVGGSIPSLATIYNQQLTKEQVRSLLDGGFLFFAVKHLYSTS